MGKSKKKRRKKREMCVAFSFFFVRFVCLALVMCSLFFVYFRGSCGALEFFVFLALVLVFIYFWFFGKLETQTF